MECAGYLWNFFQITTGPGKAAIYAQHTAIIDLFM